MPYERIYSEKLDSRKSWYAYNSSIPGYQRRNWQHSHEQNILFKSFASEIQQVNIGDIQDSHGRPVLSVLFATRKVELVYAISSFGILALALRQRNVNQDVFSSEAFQQIISAVNAVPLEKFSANSVQQFHHAGSPVIPPVQTPKRTSLSTTDIFESSEISPPEKKRRIIETGAVLANALKEVAAAHNKSIFTVLGNVASQDEHSELSSILACSTDVVFSKLGAKKALNVVLSEESRSALVQSVRVPDWVYLLLKVRLRIADAAWQTLLNLTNLGRTGVSHLI